MDAIGMEEGCLCRANYANARGFGPDVTKVRGRGRSEKNMVGSK